MPYAYSTPVVATPVPELVDPTQVGGYDIRLRGGDFNTTPDGDWELVSGVAAASQSVERELLASKGSFPRRPQWGANLYAQLFKGQTKAARDAAAAAARGCLNANPRIKRVNEVTVLPPEGVNARLLSSNGSPFTTPNTITTGLVVWVDCDAVDGRVRGPVVIKGIGRLSGAKGR